MAGPAPVTKQFVPPYKMGTGNIAAKQKADESFLQTNNQFMQQYLTSIQQALIDSSGQTSGGIVLASQLASRMHVYEFAATNFPHVGDLPTQPTLVTYDGPISFTAANLPFGVNPAYVYARWTGWLAIPAAGTYGFAIQSAGGSNLWVNGQQICAQLQAGTASVTGTAALDAGAVPIVIEWQWQIGTPNLQVLWTPPGATQDLIPSASLSVYMASPPTGYLLGYWYNGTVARSFP